MKNNFRVCFTVLGLLALLTLNNAFALQSGDFARFDRIDELLNRGDNELAWQLLQQIPDDVQTPAERLWRMARVRYEMGRTAESAQNAEDFYQEAEQFARAAIARNPGHADGYKWLAITLGARAKDNSTKTQITLSREVKANIEKAIQLAPDDDISYLVLSRWHYKISDLGFFARTVAKLIYGGLPEASLEEAEKLLLRAISIQDRIAHRYNLAKVYDRMERAEAATAQLKLALLLPVTFPEEREELDKARQKLAKLQ